MKTFNIIFFLLIIGLTACNKDFLERPPLDQVSDASFWKTDNDLRLYVNQYYVIFPSYRGRGVGMFMEDVNSDNMAHLTPDTRLNGKLTVPSSAGGHNYTSEWTRHHDVNYNWEYVRSVNIFIENYHKSTSSWENIRQYVGEAYFFRAYLYFDLLQRYGDLPWINKPLQPEDEALYSKRISRHIIADSIIADLDKAVNYMHSKGQSSDSRLNSEVALLMKSRVGLFEGTWEKYHAGTPFGVEGSDGSEFLKAAAQAAKELIDRGLYSIHNTGNPENDYQECFNQKDYTGNNEIMLWKKYSEELGLQNFSQRYVLALYWGENFGITKWLVDSYLCTDGQPVAISPLYAGDKTLADEFKNRDPRLLATVFYPGAPLRIEGTDTVTRYERPTFDDAHNSATGYRLRKSLDAHNLIPEDSKGETAHMLFRYAEALLNYAEARAELGQLTQQDVDITINKLRDRAGLPHLDIANITPDPNWEFPELSPVINEIRRERRVEMACEGMRLPDLMRWRAHNLFVGKRPRGVYFNKEEYPGLEIGKDLQVDQEGYVDIYKVALPNGFGFDPGRDYLKPIPTNEMTLNPELTQNPGW